jgi:nickel/cobalt exporter
MSGIELWSFLSLCIGLGMMHAFDADHVMAMSALASRRPGWQRAIRYCASWGLGHGITLLVIGSGVFLLGWQLPADMQIWGERAVGVLLIALGVWLWVDLARRGLKLRAHRHGGIVHTHWHEPQAPRHDHSPTFVGILHGFAGSAPLIGLLSSMYSDRVWVSLSYMLLFSLGVLVSMVAFGLAFGGLQSFISRFGGWLTAFRAGIGGIGVALGGYWIAGTL